MKNPTISKPLNSVKNYATALLGFLGAIAIAVSQVGVMVNHPMTKTFHSLLHLIGTGGGICLLIYIVVEYVSPQFTRLKFIGFVGVALLAVGLLLFIVGTFNYAILHGLLNLVTINDPIHQIPLTWAPYGMCGGTFLIGLAAFQNKTLSFRLAFLLMLASAIYCFGWWQIGDSMQRYTNLSRYVKASLIVFPFGLAWCWFAWEQLKGKN